MGDLHIGLYICLTLYHIADFFCDLSCWYYFEEPKPDQYIVFALSCAFSVIFKIYLFYRCCKTVNPLCQPHIGQTNIATVLLPELNFNVLEVLLNLFQSYLGSDMISSKSCVNVMNYRFTCCCFVGAVGQFILFVKNLCGYGGERRWFYRQDNQAINFIGMLLSLLTALVFGLPSIAIAEELRRC